MFRSIAALIFIENQITQITNDLIINDKINIAIFRQILCTETKPLHIR